MSDAQSAPSAIQFDELVPASDDTFVRLHVTPLDPDILRALIPASILPKARNISYHTIETFPEKRYGFLELPPMDANNLKRKLNSSVFKGSKIRIEDSRPVQKTTPIVAMEKDLKERRSSQEDRCAQKKRKFDPTVSEGVTLRNRKVKRGWTEPAAPLRKRRRTKSEDKKKDSEKGEVRKKEKRTRASSKYTEHEECLLKVTVPSNALANLPQETARKKGKNKSKSREITVHEFERTTKFPSFLKSTAPATDPKPAVEFKEGEGWLDEDGNIVEKLELQQGTTCSSEGSSNERKVDTLFDGKDTNDYDDSTSCSSSGSNSNCASNSSSSASSKNEDEETTDVEEAALGIIGNPQAHSADQSASGQNRKLEEAPRAASSKNENKIATPSSFPQSLKIVIPPAATPPPKHVHPLEALYKRPQPSPGTRAPASQAASFSFFDREDEPTEDEVDPPVSIAPMTPYTQSDYELRNFRSGAPTPDTAHPSQTRNFWALPPEVPEEQQEEEEERHPDDAEQGPTQDQPEESDFQKYFWEHRRELKQSWMARKKTAAKEKRYKENKARSSRTTT